MKPANGLTVFWFSYLTQPAADRLLYRTIRRNRISRIVELGIGDGRRAVRMLRLAGRYRDAGELRYVGMNLFEARPEAANRLSLKAAHRLFCKSGIPCRLLPGDPGHALARSANSLPDNELVLISRDQDADSMAQAWFYLPRMLAANAIVLQEELIGGKSFWRSIPRLEVEHLATSGTRKRAA